MAESRAAKASADLGQKEVQQEFEKAQEQGYFGTKVDPLPNSAHSLESGPDAPPVVEQHAAALQAQAEQVAADAKKEA